jgi:LysM repeat protein
MLSRRTLPLMITGALAAAMVLAGCSANPENSPKIRQKFAEVDTMKKEVEESTKLARAMSADMAIIKDQLSNLRAISPDENGVVEVLRRLDEMEARVARVEKSAAEPMIAMASSRPETPARVETKPADAAPARVTTPADFGGLAVPAREVAPATTEVASAPKVEPKAQPKVETKTQPKAESKPAASKPAAPQVRQASTRPAAPVVRGKYYVLQPGDTLEKIARENNVSVAALRSANSLPSGARPLKGQRLFIPAGK